MYGEHSGPELTGRQTCQCLGFSRQNVCLPTPSLLPLQCNTVGLHSGKQTFQILSRHFPTLYFLFRHWLPASRGKAAETSRCVALVAAAVIRGRPRHLTFHRPFPPTLSVKHTAVPRALTHLLQYSLASRMLNSTSPPRWVSTARVRGLTATCGDAATPTHCTNQRSTLKRHLQPCTDKT